MCSTVSPVPIIVDLAISPHPLSSKIPLLFTSSYCNISYCTDVTNNTKVNFPIPKFHFPRTHNPFRAASSANHDPLPNTQQEQEELVELEGGVELEARQGVSDMLIEFGATEKEAKEISNNAVKYVKMLMDGVRDLDEFGLWSSWGSDSAVSLKQKVYCLAKEKGDNGKVAFLESLGLGITSAMNVARYLKTETLPGLVQKVKYVKEMLFSDSDDANLGKKARWMMMHLSVPSDDDIQQTLSFFEKIEARRGGLDMLASGDASFHYLVGSFPRLLLLSIDSRLKPMVKFLETIGIPRTHMRIIFLLFPPIVFYDIEKDIKPRMLAFKKVGAVDNIFGKMLLKYPWIVSTSIQENYEEILSFFEMEKVPKLNVDRAIRNWPYILGCSTKKMKSMVNLFSDLGAQSKMLGQVIATSPQLLLRTPQDFLKVVYFFEEQGFNKEIIGRILCRCSEAFGSNIENTLSRKLRFLHSIGISDEHFLRVVRKYPGLFVSDTDRTLFPRLEFLMKIGLSKRDVASMVRRFSPLLGYSINNVLKPKVEFLVYVMEKPVRDVVDYPRYFSYSLEKKIKPRFWVLKGRKKECSLEEMLAKNDEEFAAEFMGVVRMLVPPPPSP